MPKRLLHCLPEGCSHVWWGRWLNAAGRLLGLHGRSLFIPPSASSTASHSLRPLVLFMGGSADSRHKVLLNQVFKRYYAAHAATQLLGYGTFHQVHTFIQYLQAHYQVGQKIVLIGHSYGGYGVMSVTRQLNARGIPVELLITLDPVACSIVIHDPLLGDPVSARQWQPSELLNEWINIYVDYEAMQPFAKQIGLPNIVALKGGPLKACQFATSNSVLPMECLGQERYLLDAHQWADAMFYGMGLEQRVAEVV